MALITVGDNVVDCYPGRRRLYPGGNCVNVAVQARRSGCATAYLGAVGDDDAGRVIRAALDAEQVAITRLRVLAGPTATASIELVDGDRIFTASDKGVSLFALDQDDLAYLETFSLAHSSYCSGLEDQVAAIAERVPLSYDFADRRDPAYAGPLLAHVRIASFSAGDLTEAETEDLVRWAHGSGPRLVLATRGAAGAVLFDGRDLHHQSAVPVTTVDTLGAGDAFIARTLVGLLDEEPIDQSLAAAAQLAADTCQQHGGFGHPFPLAATEPAPSRGPRPPAIRAGHRSQP